MSVVFKQVTADPCYGAVEGFLSLASRMWEIARVWRLQNGRVEMGVNSNKQPMHYEN